MALLRLATQWRAGISGRPRLTVLTVDHGLRAAAALEVLRVAEWAAKAGLEHVALHWTSAKPQTGIQAKARAARYDLMSEWCRNNDAPVLLTAHTLEDQAETVLMRLARTTSLDSLSGIPAAGHWRETQLLRPLLGERREALREYLRSIGQDWVEDPSNDDERFERVRIRKTLPVLRDLGITVESLGGLARRVSEAVQGLWGATDDWVKLHVVEHETAHCIVPLDPFVGQTRTLQTRILGWLISRHGSGKMPEPGELELLAAWVVTGGSRRTLGGAIIARRKHHLLIGREPGRIDPTPVPVPRSGVVLWDGRFEVRAEAGSRIIPVSCAGPLPRRRDIPGFVQAGLPAILREGETVIVPHLAVGCGAEAVFRPRLRR